MSITARSDQWVHPEAQSLTERSVSSCICLAYSIRSKNIGQSNARAHWALSERLRFWMHPVIRLFVVNIHHLKPVSD